MSVNFIMIPVDGGWGRWRSWSACSKSCGEGRVMRTRLCNSPYPVYGGKSCVGDSKESKSCIIKDCKPGDISNDHNKYEGGVKVV